MGCASSARGAQESDKSLNEKGKMEDAGRRGRTCCKVLSEGGGSRPTMAGRPVGCRPSPVKLRRAELKYTGRRQMPVIFIADDDHGYSHRFTFSLARSAARRARPGGADTAGCAAAGARYPEVGAADLRKAATLAAAAAACRARSRGPGSFIAVSSSPSRSGNFRGDTEARLCAW